MNWYKKAQNIIDKEIALNNLKQWIGNSVVVDGSGDPIVCYKGMPATDWRTNALLEIIDRSASDTASSFGGGSYAGFFSSSSEVASHFAKVLTYEGLGNGVFPVFLKIERPFVIDANQGFAGNFQFGKEGEPFREALKNDSYDGIIIKNTVDEADIYVPKTPYQIKSIFNSGLYNPDDPKINQ